MQAMMRSSRRGLIAAMLGVSAVLIVIGLAVAAAGGGGGDDGDDGQAVASTSTAVATNTPAATSTAGVQAPAATATAVRPAPIATPSPDTSVSSPPLPPAPAPGITNPTPAPPTGNTTLPKSDLPPLPSGSKRVEAPIDGVDIATLESFPPQYMLHIQAGLPSGCASKAGYEASRSGTTITVKVYNSMPESATICTMIYGMYELNINLGSDYQSGQTYTVVVNDKRTTFKAQ